MGLFIIVFLNVYVFLKLKYSSHIRWFAMMQYRMILVSVEFQGRRLSEDFWHILMAYIFLFILLLKISIRLYFVYIFLNLTYTIVKLLVSENLIISMVYTCVLPTRTPIRKCNGGNPPYIYIYIYIYMSIDKRIWKQHNMLLKWKDFISYS